MHVVPLLSPLIAAAGATIFRPTCRDLTFKVPATATNFLFNNPPDLHNSTAITEFVIDGLLSGGSVIAGTQNISGTFIVGATYCEPPLLVLPHDTLQFLVHGSTYNRSVWTGLGTSGTDYNYQVHAAQRGFRSLAVDYLGRGGYSNQIDPAHPRQRIFADPLYAVQAPLQIEILHQLLLAVRSNRLDGVKAPTNVVYVAHSYGCQLGQHLTQAHPADVDGLVLTGHSSTLNITLDFLEDLSSAADVDARFAALPLGYETIRTESVRTAHFYGGDYDAHIAHEDYVYRDTATDGDSVTGVNLITSSFAGPVLVATGDHDTIFCGGPCAQILNKTRELYPLSSDYSYYVANNTGHTLLLHHSAPATFSFINEWLGSRFPGRVHI